MDSFATIYERASRRKGGDQALEALLPKPALAGTLEHIADNRYLAEMTKAVFRSGFVWKIIENKWAGFEKAFDGFDVTACTMLSDEDLERLTRDASIVRHAKKIRSVRNNAQFVAQVRESDGGFGAYIARWPVSDIVGLWDEMKRRGDRLGGQTGRFVLRFVGKDTPMLSADVVAALVGLGVVDKNPTSKTALRAVQDAFNAWHDQSGRAYCEISRVLACSVPE